MDENERADAYAHLRYHLDYEEPSPPTLTDLLELINTLDEIREKYRVSWDYLQQLTQLVDDYFAESWSVPLMILTGQEE